MQIPIKKNKRSFLGIIFAPLLFLWAVAWVLIRIFYYVELEEHAAVSDPKWLHNDVAKKVMEEDDVPHEEGFSFVAVGDVDGMETFERILEKIKGEKHVQFLMLLGDCVSKPKKDKHLYFRKEFAEANVEWPTFVVAGNNDVGDGFSIEDFEEIYGSADFYFEFQSNLFIGLGRMSDDTDTRREKAFEFVKQVLETRRDKNKYAFVFSHYFPGTPEGVPSITFPDSERFIKLYEKWNVNYVVGGHFHRFVTSENNGMTYIVSGGGGGSLDNKISTKQGYDDVGRFHHAIIFRVKGGSIAEHVVMVEGESLYFKVEEDLERILLVDADPVLGKYPWLLFFGDFFAIMAFFSSFMLLRRKRTSAG